VGLINSDFESLTPEEFDQIIAALHSLSLVCIPFLAGRDEEAVEFVFDIWIAKEAIREIKRLVCGAGEPGGAVDFGRFSFELYEKTVAGMFGLAMFAIPSVVDDIGVEAVMEYSLACLIAGDAVDEVKQQVYGVEMDGAHGTVA
jgi:energy-converting hydrogenase Eha subunit H